jgi:cytoskeletal protein RodZ
VLFVFFAVAARLRDKIPKGGFQMTKLSLCVAFTIALLVGMNSIPSLVYAQTKSAQPSEPPQTDNAAQPDETTTPDESTGPEEQGEETQGEATDEPENQTDDQSPQDQE